MAEGRNYERKGDAFSQKVEDGHGPRTVQRWYHPLTDREYYTRVPTSACWRLDIGDLREELHAADQPLSDLHVVWAPSGGTSVVLKATAPVPRWMWLIVKPTRVSLCTTLVSARQGSRRPWFVCPLCEQRCGCLYASPYGPRGDEKVPAVVGCRTCLGLTDKARQTHGTTRWAIDVILQSENSADVKPRNRFRSIRTVERANQVQLTAVSRSTLGK